MVVLVGYPKEEKCKISKCALTRNHCAVNRREGGRWRVLMDIIDRGLVPKDSQIRTRFVLFGCVYDRVVKRKEK